MTCLSFLQLFQGAEHGAVNHRTTSACNCISVPIINVSTALLFTKAVIVKSQVGEFETQMLILRNPSFAIQCPSAQTPNLL